MQRVLGFGVGEPVLGWGNVVPGVEFVDVGFGGEEAGAELERRGDFGVRFGVVREVWGKRGWRGR